MSSYLINIYFILKTNAAILIAQLNRIAINLLGSLVIRQIIQIRLFNFKVYYIPGKKNTAIDSLLRRERTTLDNINNAYKVDINNWVITQLDLV